MDVDSSSKFIGSLTKFLQSLCNGYVEFQRGVELVGHIYLSIDTGEKVDYILHEKVSKNDENSVTFVSNSFHAQPLADQDKNKAAKDSDKDRSGAKGSKVDSDDDIMIVDQLKGEPGSTNLGTIPSRGMKRPAPRGIQSSSSASLSSSFRNRQQLGPSASVTSPGAQQDGINMGDVKLEQMSTDELLSLASQVGEGTSPAHGPPPTSQQGGRKVHRSSSLSESAGQPVWIKQEAPDDTHGGPDPGWSHNRDGQSDSSNSGSNLYPVMMHQNPAFSSGPVFPGFPSMSGPSTSSSQHQPLPGTSGGSGLPYGSPGLGSPLDMSGIDPAATKYLLHSGNTSSAKAQSGSKKAAQQWTRSWTETGSERAQMEKTAAEKLREYRHRMRVNNPEQYMLYKMRDALRKRRKRAQLKGLNV